MNTPNIINAGARKQTITFLLLYSFKLIASLSVRYKVSFSNDGLRYTETANLFSVAVADRRNRRAESSHGLSAELAEINRPGPGRQLPALLP